MKKLLDKVGKHKILKLIIAIIVLIFPVGVMGFSTGTFLILIGCFILVYCVAVSGLDVLYGYCGQISLGHAAYFAIGAYGSAILNLHLGIPPMITALIASVAATLIAAVIAFPAANLKFHFLSLATIAFGEIVYYLAGNSPNKITGNYIGIFPNKMSLFGLEISTNIGFYYFALIILVIALIIKQHIIKSKVGRAFEAIRENVTAAGGMGINVRKYKVMAFCVSAFFVAFAGAIYGNLVNYISPTTFTINLSIMFMTMLLFGGKGDLWGPIVGATAIQIINEALRDFEKYQTFVYGIIILVVILIIPNGVTKIKFNRKNKKEMEAPKENA